MLNPDGRIWVDFLSNGLADTGECWRRPLASVLCAWSPICRREVHSRSSRVSAELPQTGERFEGLLPPVVAAPAFAIRKPAKNTERRRTNERT